MKKAILCLLKILPYLHPLTLSLFLSYVEESFSSAPLRELKLGKILIEAKSHLVLNYFPYFFSIGVMK